MSDGEGGRNEWMEGWNDDERCREGWSYGWRDGWREGGMDTVDRKWDDQSNALIGSSK